MKKIVLIILTLNLCHLVSLGQAGNWLWGRQGTTIGTEEGWSSATDVSGNVYATGAFGMPSVTFGSTTLTCAGQYDMFLVKYSSTGVVLWATSAGGNYNDQGWSVATDATGNAYVTGYFNSPTMIFGSDTLFNTGGWNMFLAKYSSTGNLLWVKSEGGNSSVLANSVTTNSAGNIFVTGYYGTLGILIFGSDTLTNTSINSTKTFTVEYTPSGTALWARSAGGILNCFGFSIATDLLGDVYITGSFDSPSITFGTTTVTNTAADSTTDIFIAKYSATGSLIWARNAGGTNADIANSIATDALGNAYITGYFNSPTIAFDSYILANADITGNSSDMFITKYSSSGTVLYTKSAGGLNGTGSGDRGWSVATDASGVYVSGGFTSPSIVFGSDTLHFPTGASDPMFIVKYDSSLNVLCASVLSSGGDDWSGLSTDGNGNVYVAGDITGSIPIIVGLDTLSTTTSQELFFIAKYRCPTELGINEITTSQSISIYPNPASTLLNIHHSTCTSPETLLITDLLGTVVYKEELHGIDNTISISTWSAGIYFYEVKSEKESARGKFIKE